MFISELQNAGDHPKNFPNWDPHSTYFGTLAEKGMFGFISLLLLAEDSTCTTPKHPMEEPRA